MRNPFVRRSPVRATRYALAGTLLVIALLAACSGGGAPAETRPSAAAPDPEATVGSLGTDLPRPTPTRSARSPIDLTILHTNDVRGEIDPCG